MCDGKKREDGVRSFRAAAPSNSPTLPLTRAPLETVYGLGNRKNVTCCAAAARRWGPCSIGSRRYSGGGHGRVSVWLQVLRAPTPATRCDHRSGPSPVDGDAARRAHHGKPAPDSFPARGRTVGVTPDAAAVFGDALSGVVAGRAGNSVVVGYQLNGPRSGRPVASPAPT